MTRHDVDLVGLHLTVEPHLGLALDQTLTKLAGHGLDVALVEVEFLGDLPVRQVEAHEIQAQHPDPQWLVMAGQNRAGEVVETRLAVLAQPALARVPDIVPAVPDHVGAVAGRAPHTGRPAMLADQVEALGVVEQRGQADQVGAHGTFTSAGGASPRSTVHLRLHHTRNRDPIAKHGTAQLITPEPAMSLSVLDSAENWL
jgi:hypothetical protein